MPSINTCHHRTAGQRRRPMHRASSAILAAMIVVMLSACAPRGIPHTTHPVCDFRDRPEGVTPYGDGEYLFPPDGQSMVPMPLSTVSISDFGLRNRLLVQSVNGMRGTDGRLNVYVRYVNCTDYPMIIESRTQFLNRNQGLSEPVTGWKRTVMPPNTIGNYNESSVRTPSPHNFIVEVREQS